MAEEEGDEVGTVELELALRARLRIEPMALQEEFIRCPMDVAFLGAQHGRAIRDHLRAKGRAKRIRGLVFIESRKKLIDLHGKATEEHIKAEVEQDRRVEDADGDEIDAEVARETAKANFAAVMAKKDMLVQLGSTERAEMGLDPVVRQERRARRGDG